jgi:hypothetical protein
MKKRKLTLKDWKDIYRFFGYHIGAYMIIITILSLTGILPYGILRFILFGIGLFFSITWAKKNPYFLKEDYAKKIFGVDD